MSEDTPDLMNLAKQASQRSGFIAQPLLSYQEAHKLTNEQLAEAVGVPVEHLGILALCPLPKEVSDIAIIAKYVQADVFQLTTWLQQNGVWQAEEKK